MDSQKVRVRLPSGQNVDLSENVYEQYYCSFDEKEFFNFSNAMNAEQYFPQILQFFFVMRWIFNGRTSLREILICNLAFGITYTVLWFVLKLYKLPGLSLLSCFLGTYIFRFCLHFIAIAIIAFFVIGDLKVILYCMIGGIITQLIKSFLSATLSTAKYADEVAIYVTRSRL